MTCEILTVGDELLIGQVVNTNQAFIAQQLSRIGVPVVRMTTVGDRLEEIVPAIESARSRAEVVILTGGLGPTHDDVTRTAVCRVFDSGLVPDARLRAHIEDLLTHRGLSWSPAAEDQTRVPHNAVILPNPVGTAPGLLFERDGKIVVALPGVPYEMKEIVTGSIIPFLEPRVAGSVILHRTLRTTGIAESVLAQHLGDLDTLLDGASLAFLPSPTGVRLRISVHGRERSAAAAVAAAAEQRIREKAGKWVYGVEDQELEEILGSLLSERGMTIAVAESCTGGLIADRLTDVPGSSGYFERGVITYSNRSKIALLGVPPETLERHGAVSREVAKAMAEGIRRAASATIGLSTTGIAGPSGGSTEKPVGLVWIGYADPSETIAVRMQFGGQRRRVKERASQAALELVRRKILRIP